MMGSVFSYLTGTMIVKIIVSGAIGVGLLFAGAKLIKMKDQVQESRHQKRNFKERQEKKTEDALGYFK